MNREQKLSLIIGFTVILLVGVLISDHLSGARHATVLGVDGDDSDVFGTQLAATAVAPFEDVTLRAPPAQDPIFAPEPEPLAVIDQSAGERPADVAGDHADLINEIAERSGKVINQGTSLLFELPETPALAKADTPKEVWHTVAPGETLWEISERYYGTGTRWKLIAEHNEGRMGNNGAMRVGVRLSIPHRAGMATNATAQPKSTPQSTRTYTVRANDTIGEIAESLLGTSRRWREIVDLNRDVISNEHVVRVGDVLKIPAK